MAVSRRFNTIFMLFAFIVCFNTSQVNAITEASDIQALMQIKASMDPSTIQPGSCLYTWDFSVDPCDNLFGANAFSCGIDCGAWRGETQRITAVKLDSFGYSGELSPSIGNLTFLQYLQLSGNSIKGAIPSTIGRLSQLQFLDLSDNSFSGPVPPAIGFLQSLRVLNLASNSVTGGLPASFTNLSSLSELRMQQNSLSGSLVSPNSVDFRAMKGLQVLDLSSNGFTGGLPLNWPPNAISISFKNNRFSGELSKDHIDGLSPYLNVLDLSGNNLSGSLDDSLFKHQSLQQLNLSNNQFTRIVETGVEADAVGDRASAIASDMVAVDLSYNQISGNLPIVFASMQKLASLSLSHNAFSGRIDMRYAIKAVAGIVGLQPFHRLMLDGNYLTGPLPQLFMKLLPGEIVASFVDNCLLNCSTDLFFCQGGSQKPDTLCRLFNISS